MPNSDPRQIITPLVLVGLGLGVGEGLGLGNQKNWAQHWNHISTYIAFLE